MKSARLVALERADETPGSSIPNEYVVWLVDGREPLLADPPCASSIVRLVRSSSG